MMIVKIMDIFSCNKNFKMHNMSEIEKDEVYHLVPEGVILRWQHLILFLFWFNIHGSAV